MHTLQTFTNSAPQILAAMTPGQSDYLIFGTLKWYVGTFHIDETWQLH